MKTLSEERKRIRAYIYMEQVDVLQCSLETTLSFLRQPEAESLIRAKALLSKVKRQLEEFIKMISSENKRDTEND